MAGLVGLVANEGPLLEDIFREQVRPPFETQCYREHTLEPNIRDNTLHGGSVPRDGDTFRPKSLIFDCIDITQPIDIKRVFMEIGGHKFMNVPFSIFKTLSKETVVGSKRIYTFDFNMYMKDIPLICLAFHEARFQVQVNSNVNIRGISVCSVYRHLDTVQRREMAQQQNIRDPVQYFQTVNCINHQRNTEYGIDITLLDGFSKGYILEGPIDTLEELTLYFNNIETYKLNQATLCVLGRRLEPNLLYIPFNQDIALETNTFEAYQGAINHNRIDNVRMKIKQSEATENTFTIHSLCLNRIWYLGGMAGPATTPIFENTYDFNTAPHRVVRAPAQIVDIRWTNENKVINPEKATCPINYEEVTEGMQYCECSKCKNCYIKDALVRHFEGTTRSSARKCPMCREPWSNWVIYTNAVAPAPEPAVPT
jgi:hypothetical protein